MRQEQGEQRAHTGRWNGRNNRQRMDQAFIKNSENQIDGDQRGSDQPGLAAERFLVSLRGSCEARLNSFGNACRGCGRIDLPDGVAQGNVLLQVE